MDKCPKTNAHKFTASLQEPGYEASARISFMNGSIHCPTSPPYVGKEPTVLLYMHNDSPCVSTVCMTVRSRIEPSINQSSTGTQLPTSTSPSHEPTSTSPSHEPTSTSPSHEPTYVIQSWPLWALPSF